VIFAASLKMPWLAIPVLLTRDLFSHVYAWLVVFQGLDESGCPSARLTCVGFREEGFKGVRDRV